MGGRVGGWAKLMRPRDVLTSSIQAIWRLPGSTNLPPPPPLLPSPPPQGILTVKDMVLVNLPNSPSQYPAGLLSSMPWYLDTFTTDM